MQAARRHRTQGFSLVELSIVLVILGLLVGGILAGQSLIRASELRKVGTDLDKFRTATFAFRDRYFSWPGDINNASSFWPTAINGFTNKQIPWNSEGINFWNHLQQAGLLEGNIAPFSGTASAITIGTHVPRCPLGGCGYSMAYFSVWTTQPHLVGRSILVMGAEAANSYTEGLLPGFVAEQLWNIDTKYDDGRADLGNIIAGGCTTGAYPDRLYALSNTTTNCRMLVDFFR